MRIGSLYLKSGTCDFSVWAPLLNEVVLDIVHPDKREVPMQKDKDGYWRVSVDNIKPGARYFYRPGKKDRRPDPASFYQPEGVHGPSEVIDHSAFKWSDAGWKGIAKEEMVIYELHVGTFTPEGTFEAIIKRLGDLSDTGINAVELMPVAQFPGERNWGYDGVYPYSVQNSYGGPEGLKKLVNACHEHGIAVMPDVVYNHLGPEGNYFVDFGPYFTTKYTTPWGEAVNYDGDYSRGVRDFFIENALYWFADYHMDALRIDAIHSIFDMGPKHILKELSERTEEFSNAAGRKLYLIAESDLNDARVIRSREKGGYGIDAQWCDDFHHALHTLLTKEKNGYYEDFGEIGQLEKSLSEGFVYDGIYSKFRKKIHGNSSADIPAANFIVFSQNHDQVGNRMFGERLSNLVDFEALKLAAGAILTAPYIPLLFMGEEYAEERPFLYFVSHSDPGLIQAVQDGRRREFTSFGWRKEPPDPQDKKTFLESGLKWNSRNTGQHKILLDFYRELIKLRRRIPALAHLNKGALKVSDIEGKVLVLYRWQAEDKIMALMNFDAAEINLTLNISEPGWEKVIDSSDPRWMGTGATAPEKITESRKVIMRPMSFVLYKKESSQ